MQLSLLNHNFTFIGLTETWFNEGNVKLYCPKGYNHEYFNRSDKKGGGVSLYIKKTVEYQLRSDLVCNNIGVECVFIEIDKEVFSLQKLHYMWSRL